MTRPTVHLICSAHLDPVWQWTWEEGASEALSTFRTACEILRGHPRFIFCHNEAVLYQWVERYDTLLFREIQNLAARDRWAVSGGWYLQPDVNLPGTESLIRQIIEGRRYFWEKFRARPLVAYNFDSFGHSGGLPQILRLAGFEMYIHMRPQGTELALPSDLYRWRGIDGSEILTHRISVGLYHSERENIGHKVGEGIDLALKLGRDVAVFWGLGNHGGGATRDDLARIDALIAGERRVRIIHSTPDLFYHAVRREAPNAPVFEGELQRVFTGCYTSLSRIKRRAQRSLGRLVQAEALSTASWRLAGQPYPAGELDDAWRGHLFNDFHDIITGSCVEPAEQDALELYGRVEETARLVSLGAAAALTAVSAEADSGTIRPDSTLPLTVLNANPSLTRVPVELECMADYRPFWKGLWELRLFCSDGKEVACQEEQPESLLPFNDWRRKISFMADLPGVGASRYYLRAVPVRTRKMKRADDLKHADPSSSAINRSLIYEMDKKRGLVSSLKSPALFGGRGTPELLSGPLLEPLVVEDEGDSWGTELWRYSKALGKFGQRGESGIILRGPIRTITQSVLIYKKSRIVIDMYSYPRWPVLEFRLRINWNEERRRLKLRIPTVMETPRVICEIPGGAIARPADGEEHVHGRWMMLEARLKGRGIALGIVNSGQHGFDFIRGEVRLSVLRSPAYCHERGFEIGASPARKFADIGIHDVRVLVTAGDPGKVRALLPGLADWLSAPPLAYPHLPAGGARPPGPAVKAVTRLPVQEGRAGQKASPRQIGFLHLAPGSIRLLACKRSDDGRAVIVRLQETAGRRSDALLKISTFESDICLSFKPFEIKTLKIRISGRWDIVSLQEEGSRKAGPKEY
jgi:alpha-mannosidase